MATPERTTAPGYGIILAGVVLAFASAVVPFHNAGYRLDNGVLIAGMLPYLLFGLPAVLVRGLLTLVTGLMVLATHAWLVARERFLDGADYGDGLIYLVPIVLTLALVPLIVVALRRRWHD